MLHQARLSAPPKAMLPGTLGAFAEGALPQPSTKKSPLPSSQVTSTPKCPLKRKRTSSSPPTFRNQLMKDFSIIESELSPSQEQLRDTSLQLSISHTPCSHFQQTQLVSSPELVLTPSDTIPTPFFSRELLITTLLPPLPPPPPSRMKIIARYLRKGNVTLIGLRM